MSSALTAFNGANLIHGFFSFQLRSIPGLPICLRREKKLVKVRCASKRKDKLSKLFESLSLRLCRSTISLKSDLQLKRPQAISVDILNNNAACYGALDLPDFKISYPDL